MKILLAGATGAVGRLLVPLLVEAGHEVIGTTRSAAKGEQIRALGARPLTLNVLDRAATFAALAEARPDAVIHQLTDLAGRDFAANSRLRTEGVPNLVDASKAVGVQRMIAQSIGWLYAPGAGPNPEPAREEEPLDFNAPPSRKSGVAVVYAMESAVAQMPVGIILRYGLFYGPATWYSRDELTTRQVLAGEIVATDAVVSFIHVADAAEAALLALDWPAGVYNIVDDEPAAGTEWLPLYAKLVGAPPPPTKAGREAWERGASNAKARSLGWRPKYATWREGFPAVLG